MGEPTKDLRGRVFISYRREDAAYPAGWLFDRLAEQFGEDQIFKDVDSIELGDDFVEVINEAVGATDVLLAIIGDRWLTVTDEQGRPRLDDPEDFVRLEIEAALTRRVRIIPVLVEGATMPREDQLPRSLMPLARRQALELSPSRFASDTGRLLRALERAVAEARAEPEDTASEGIRQAEKRRAEMPPTPSLGVRVARRARPLAVTLALAGAALGIIATTLPGGRPGSDTAFMPELLGVPLLVAGVAILLQAGRIRDRLAYGLLLGFGLLTVAGAIGIGLVSREIDGAQGNAPLAFLGAGALVFAAGMVGTAGIVRSPGAWSTPFRWGPASLLAVLGALVGIAALFVPFGTSDDGSSGSVRHLGNEYGLTGIALEPVVAIVTACAAAYALGKGGAVRVLAAGVALAVGAQTGLLYGNLLVQVSIDWLGHWDSGELREGFLVGFAAAGLMLAAGLVGRRSAEPR